MLGHLAKRFFLCTKGDRLVLCRLLSNVDCGRVVIGGGSGFVGTQLAKDLTNRGYEKIRVISRRKTPRSVTWDEIRRTGLPPETSAVVNLAGVNVLDPLKRWNSQFKEEVYKSRIDTAKAISSSITRMPPSERPKVFIQISGIGFYDNNSNKVFDEDCRNPGNDFFAQLVQDWETAARLPESVTETRQVFVRPGVVLGRDGGMIQRLYWPFYMGVGGPMGSGDQPLPWIHVHDLTGIIIHAIENEKVTGILNGVAPDIITNKHFAESFGRSLFRPALFPTPEFVLNATFGQERAEMITKGQKVTPKRTIEAGYKYKFATIDEACKQLAG